MRRSQAEAALNIVLLGSDTRTETLGQLLTQAGYCVRSEDAASASLVRDMPALPHDRLHEIILQIGNLNSGPLDGDTMDARFPLLQMALCCWLVRSASSTIDRSLPRNTSDVRVHAEPGERVFDSA